jgi:hypothetical protein
MKLSLNLGISKIDDVDSATGMVTRSTPEDWIFAVSWLHLGIGFLLAVDSIIQVELTSWIVKIGWLMGILAFWIEFVHPLVLYRCLFDLCMYSGEREKDLRISLFFIVFIPGLFISLSPYHLFEMKEFLSFLIAPIIIFWICVDLFFKYIRFFRK